MAKSKKVPRAKEPVIFVTLQSKFLPVLKRRASLVRKEIESTNIISKSTGENLPFKNRLYILFIAGMLLPFTFNYSFVIFNIKAVIADVLLKQAKLNQKDFKGESEKDSCWNYSEYTNPARGLHVIFITEQQMFDYIYI